VQQGDTISAIATAPGAGGIGVIRLSGEHAVAVADRVFTSKSGRKLAELDTYRAAYGRIVDEQGHTVDECVALVMRAPHSYTKEDIVELQCHGSSQALKTTLSLTWRCGARPAERGEFTKRAFLNGRLDLTQAQAAMEIIEARTDRSLEMAAGHLTGRFSEKIHAMRQSLLAMIAHIEATIDFPEDGVDEVVAESIRQEVTQLREDIEKLLRTAHTGRILRDGLLTAIVGKPNVGKSSLLNALLREDRAIVTDIPGTTRDAIEEYANVGGVPLRIIDTAGIRATDDAVEQIGVEKARGYVEKASLVLALFDGSAPLSSEDREIAALVDGKETIALINKADLPQTVTPEELRGILPENTPVLAVSTKTNAGFSELEQLVVSRVYGREEAGDEGTFIDDGRQADILRRVDGHLGEALMTISRDLGLDFISIDLRSAWEKLGELTGETVGEDIIDEIFSRFCIGK